MRLDGSIPWPEIGDSGPRAAPGATESAPAMRRHDAPTHAWVFHSHRPVHKGENDMKKRVLQFAIAASLLALAACGGGSGSTAEVGGGGAQVTNGTGSQQGDDLVTTVAPANYSGPYASEKLAVFNLLNAYRSRCGFGKVAQNALIDQAAQNHAAYLHQDPYAGHRETPGVPGFTGVTVWDRLTAAGYSWSQGTEILGTLVWGAGTVGNTTFSLVSATELAATAHLRALLAAPYHLAGGMSLNREVGIGISNQATSLNTSVKYLNVNFGTPKGEQMQQLGRTTIATFPCQGVSGVEPVFAGEEPDPFPDVNRDLTPYGQPVYVMTSVGSTVTVNLQTSSIVARGGAPVNTRLLTRTTDPHGIVETNEVFLVPTERLADNRTYDVILNGTLSALVSGNNPTGAWSRAFSFTTGVFKGE